MDNYFDQNMHTDEILKVVFKHAGSRKIIFSSFDPDTCIMQVVPDLYVTQTSKQLLKGTLWVWQRSGGLGLVTLYQRIYSLYSRADTQCGFPHTQGSGQSSHPYPYTHIQQVLWHAMQKFNIEEGHIQVTKAMYNSSMSLLLNDSRNLFRFTP